MPILDHERQIQSMISLFLVRIVNGSPLQEGADYG